MHYVEEHRSCKEVEWIVVHVTAVRDSKGKAPSSVLEKMRSDFDSKGGGGLPRLARQDVHHCCDYVCMCLCFARRFISAVVFPMLLRCTC